MALSYLSENNDFRKGDDADSPKPCLREQSKPPKGRRIWLFILLLLANMIAINAAYGLWTAEKDEKIWQVVTSDNIISELWEKCPSVPKTNPSGTVMGILYGEARHSALVNDILIHEGDTLRDVRVVEIRRDKIRFEKKGKMWTQAVYEKPKLPW